MIRYALILILFCIDANANENYINYHKEIIVAERYFLIGEFKTSLEKYKSVFTTYKKPFAKDCLIAAQIACLSYDTVNARYFFEKGFEHGLNWGVLNRIDIIRNILINSRAYEQSLRKLYEPARKKFIQSLDTTLRFRVLMMLHNDGYYKISVAQKYRNESADTAHWRTGDSLYAICLDKNTLELQEIIKKRGYPGEHLIGLLDEGIDNHNPDSVSVLPNSTPVYITVSSVPSVMYYHNRYGYQLMRNELLEAVKNGELNPREYAMIQEWSYNAIKDWDDYSKRYGGNPQFKSSRNFPAIKVKCNIALRDCRYNLFIDRYYYTKDTALVDKCRKEIGMCSLLHDKNKKEFEKTHGLKLYFGLFENL